jgi:hypothetical protein
MGLFETFDTCEIGKATKVFFIEYLFPNNIITYVTHKGGNLKK